MQRGMSFEGDLRSVNPWKQPLTVMLETSIPISVNDRTSRQMVSEDVEALEQHNPFVNKIYVFSCFLPTYSYEHIQLCFLVLTQLSRKRRSHRDLHVNVYSSFVHNCQNLEVTEVPFYRLIDQWNIMQQQKEMNYRATKRYGGTLNVPC